MVILVPAEMLMWMVVIAVSSILFVTTTATTARAAAIENNNKNSHVCGELFGCALYDITNTVLDQQQKEQQGYGEMGDRVVTHPPRRIIDLYAHDVTYKLQASSKYSISCYVYGGHVDALHIVYGNRNNNNSNDTAAVTTTHTERKAPYWVGGNTNTGVPYPVPYLATPGMKTFTVTGVLNDEECFVLTQNLIAVIPNDQQQNQQQQQQHHQQQEL